MKLNHLLITFARINLKLIENLHVGFKVIKILEENKSSKILDISQSNIFSDISPQAKETKEKIMKWDYLKLNSFCTAKGIINKMKRQPIEWENISANGTSMMG